MKTGYIAVAAVLCAGVSAWGASALFARPGVSARITRIGSADNVSVDLSRDGSFRVFGMENVTFETRDGKIAFTESDCPDHICVRTGFIGVAGESAACLPNGLLLTVSGEGEIHGVSR
ncbi:MAG: NusG domain II-containing protein [Clostridiales bacterium]|nr:NusG domain II-containing protein [Clostridiales bacterium]